MPVEGGGDLSWIPHIVMGHSMSSFVEEFLTLHWDDIDGAIVTGTGQQSWYQVSLALAIAKILRSVKETQKCSRMLHGLIPGSYDRRFKEPFHGWLCSDPKDLRSYDDDSYCGFIFTNAVYSDLFVLIKGRMESEECFDRIPRDLPMIFVSGVDDPVGDLGKGISEAERALKMYSLHPDIGLYLGIRHEILNEIGREQVYDDLTKWTLARSVRHL